MAKQIRGSTGNRLRVRNALLREVHFRHAGAHRNRRREFLVCSDAWRDEGEAQDDSCLPPARLKISTPEA